MTDFFPLPDGFDDDPAEAMIQGGRLWRAAYARYLAGVKAVVDSYNIPVGLTPKDEIWRLNKARLYRYRPVKPAAERHPVPLLLVYALINKPFIFDLAPGRSFVEYIVAEGFDVYLLDWGTPGPEDRHTGFDDYVTEYLSRAVRKLLRHSGAEQFSMLGYCLGATLAILYAALYPEAPLRNLMLLTLPLDYSGPPEESMAIWLTEERLDVDRIVDAFGNVPGELIELWAKMLKPAENFVGIYNTLWKQLDDPDAVRGWQAINRWVEDVVPLSGAAFRGFAVDIVRHNQLMAGTYEVDGKPVDLANIRANLCNVVARYDHLISQSQ
jgi:polyhydroxyalkanoate synthase